jgi:large subunit ribosomal protein L15
MSLIHKPKGATRPTKRLGRGQGSGVGGTAGKGENGQNSRSGGGVRPGFEGGQMPLYRRIARRGFSNYPFKVETVVVNLDRLSENFESGEKVTWLALVERNIIKPSAGAVKILAVGDLTKKLTICLPVSAAAKAKIKKAGGSVELEQDIEHGQ